MYYLGFFVLVFRFIGPQIEGFTIGPPLALPVSVAMSWMGKREKKIGERVFA